MLTSITVENWKSFGEATLHLDPLTVLIGTNSSGKSNLLDALAFLYRIASGTMLTSALQGDGVVPPLRGGMEWAARKPETWFAISANFRSSPEYNLDYKITCQIVHSRCELKAEYLTRTYFRIDKNGKRRSPQRPISLFWTDAPSETSPTITARLYNGTKGTPRQLGRTTSALFQLSGQKNQSEIQDGIDSILNALRTMFILDPIPSHMRGFSALSDRLDADGGNIAGVVSALPEEAKREMEDTLTFYASKLPEGDITRVYAETVGKFKSDAMLYCEERFGESSDISVIDARGMSDGTLRFLAILTALLTRPSQSLLVIEEIDNGLHPSRSDILLQMLRQVGQQRGVDIMITTHNPALLDRMGMEMVPFITVAHRDPAAGTSSLTLLEDVDLLPKLLAQGQVGTLASRGLIEKALDEQLSSSAT
jgi:predicted ATPase